MTHFDIKERTLTCLIQTGESFSLNLKIAISSNFPTMFPDVTSFFAPTGCTEPPAKCLQALSKPSPSSLQAPSNSSKRINRRQKNTVITAAPASKTSPSCPFITRTWVVQRRIRNHNCNVRLGAVSFRMPLLARTLHPRFLHLLEFYSSRILWGSIF